MADYLKSGSPLAARISVTRAQLGSRTEGIEGLRTEDRGWRIEDRGKRRTESDLLEPLSSHPQLSPSFPQSSVLSLTCE